MPSVASRSLHNRLGLRFIAPWTGQVHADDGATDAFRTGLEGLRALARDNSSAVICAEAVLWRCHPRIISDCLLADGVSVAHIMRLDRVDAAKLTSGAQSLPDWTLTYSSADDGTGSNGYRGRERRARARNVGPASLRSFRSFRACLLSLRLGRSTAGKSAPWQNSACGP